VHDRDAQAEFGSVGNSSAVKNALSSTLAEMPVPVPLTVRDHLKKSAGV